MAGKLLDRRAPEGGYHFPEKEKFRSFVWSKIAGRSAWRERGQHVLMMPSLEGAEIDEALRRGFRQEDIHIVDANPAIVATLKRKYTTVNTYGVTVDRAHERIAKADIALYGASLDFCGTASWQTAEELARCSHHDAWQTGARVVVNVLRGREPTGTRRSVIANPAVRKAAWFRLFLDGWSKESTIAPTTRDLWRAWMLAFTLPGHVAIPMATRPYVSSNGQSFLTIVFSVYRAADLARAWTDPGCRWASMAGQAFAAEMAICNLMSTMVDLGFDDDEASDDDVAVYPESAINRATYRQTALGLRDGREGFLVPRVVDAVSTFERKYGRAFGREAVYGR